jgi:hypothetical protein
MGLKQGHDASCPCFSRKRAIDLLVSVFTLCPRLYALCGVNFIYPTGIPVLIK